MSLQPHDYPNCTPLSFSYPFIPSTSCYCCSTVYAALLVLVFSEIWLVFACESLWLLKLLAHAGLPAQDYVTCLYYLWVPLLVGWPWVYGPLIWVPMRPVLKRSPDGNVSLLNEFSPICVLCEGPTVFDIDLDPDPALRKGCSRSDLWTLFMSLRRLSCLCSHSYLLCCLFSLFSPQWTWFHSSCICLPFSTPATSKELF